jgi:hypothetical protein
MDPLPLVDHDRLGRQIASCTVMNSLLYRYTRIAGIKSLLPCVVLRDIDSLHASTGRPRIFIHIHFGPLIGLAAGLLKANIRTAILTAQQTGILLPPPLLRHQLVDSSASRISALLGAIEYLETGSSILIAVDGAGTSIRWVNLLGRRSPFLRGAAMLSRLTGAPMIPLVTRWMPQRGRIEFQALAPIAPPERGDAREIENSLIDESARRYEMVMRESPHAFSRPQLYRFLSRSTAS